MPQNQREGAGARRIPRPTTTIDRDEEEEPRNGVCTNSPDAKVQKRKEKYRGDAVEATRERWRKNTIERLFEGEIQEQSEEETTGKKKKERKKKPMNLKF